MRRQSFYADFKSQNVTAVHVNWKPKAGGKKKMLDLLGRLNKSN